MGVPSIPASMRPTCGSCGEAWFGNVDYCPYCGRASAGAPFPNIARRLPAADQGPAPHATHEPSPGTRRVRWKRVAAVLGSVVLAAVVLAIGQLAMAPGDRAGAQDPVPSHDRDAARSGRIHTGVAASAPALPSEPLVQQQASPTAPNRSLCSVANEAAGLCKAQ